MMEAMDRSRVKGFLDVRGRQIVNGDGEEVLLNGWALANWLHSEGYLWQCDVPRFDRQRRMEGVIEELVGKAGTEKFWKHFRDSYVTEADIQMMAEMGCNSVRVPINARLFMEEGPRLQFIEEGFERLDRLIDWCEGCGLYVLIDLHAAPGGQTGTYIDDSVDDVCRLFADQYQFEKGLALWERLAERYAGRWIVGGYELLNQPIRAVRFEGDVDLDGYIPRLVEFYGQCIERVRAHDRNHIVVLEGAHWGQTTDIFDRVLDPKMVIGFHLYGTVPDITSFKPFLEVSERLNVPLWLCTGDNTLEWYSAVMPLATSLGIGFNIWAWKRLSDESAPCSIQKPANWSQVADYVTGGPHPGYENAIRILDAYAHNALIANCSINEKINANIHLIPGCVIAGTDFDELPGLGVSYDHPNHAYPATDYRRDTGMWIYRRFPERTDRMKYEGEWAQFVLRMGEGDFACYTLNEVTMHSGLEIRCWSEELSEIEVYQDDRLMERFELSATRFAQVLSGLRLENAKRSVIKLRVTRGVVDVESLVTQADE